MYSWTFRSQRCLLHEETHLPSLLKPAEKQWLSLALFLWLSSPNWMYPLHFCLPFSSFIACLRASGACGLQVPLSLMLAFTYHFQKSLCLTHHQPLITSKVPQIILTRPLASDEDSSLVPQDACLGCRRWSLCWCSPCFMYSRTLSFLFLTLLLS